MLLQKGRVQPCYGAQRSNVGHNTLLAFFLRLQLKYESLQLYDRLPYTKVSSPYSLSNIFFDHIMRYFTKLVKFFSGKRLSRPLLFRCRKLSSFYNKAQNIVKNNKMLIVCS